MIGNQVQTQTSELIFLNWFYFPIMCNANPINFKRVDLKIARKVIEYTFPPVQKQNHESLHNLKMRLHWRALWGQKQTRCKFNKSHTNALAGSKWIMEVFLFIGCYLKVGWFVDSLFGFMAHQVFELYVSSTLFRHSRSNWYTSHIFFLNYNEARMLGKWLIGTVSVNPRSGIQHLMFLILVYNLFAEKVMGIVCYII